MPGSCRTFWNLQQPPDEGASGPQLSLASCLLPREDCRDGESPFRAGCPTASSPVPTEMLLDTRDLSSPAMALGDFEILSFVFFWFFCFPSFPVFIGRG